MDYKFSTLLAKSKLHSKVKKIMIITLFIPYYKKKVKVIVHPGTSNDLQ
jgi:hypothetical protein